MLVLTLGDPHSVSVELLAALLAPSGACHDLLGAHPVLLVGSAWQWHDQLRRLQRPALDLQPLSAASTVTGLAPGLYLVDCGTVESAVPAPELTPVQRGAISVQALDWLQTLPPPVCGGERLAVVTAPIDKHACHAAGFAFPGQTEYFSALWGKPAVMILAGPRLRVGLVTNHLPLSAVAASISADGVAHKLELFIDSLRRDFGLACPRVAVCGLNPHAGDGGLFGDEEARCIRPALARVAQAVGTTAVVAGPVPADTAFYRCYHGEFDGVLAMYHDQGLGPLKTVHFDDAVNLSGGLPHFRASPDHGPARDLFLRGRAAPASFAAALALARAYLARGR